VRDARAGEAGNQGKPLQPNPIDSLRIRVHKSQSDNPGLCGRRSQRMGSRNLSNLSGHILTGNWPGS
jgi:hypothetical protein